MQTHSNTFVYHTSNNYFIYHDGDLIPKYKELPNNYTIWKMSLLSQDHVHFTLRSGKFFSIETDFSKYSRNISITYWESHGTTDVIEYSVHSQNMYIPGNLYQRTMLLVYKDSSQVEVVTFGETSYFIDIENVMGTMITQDCYHIVNFETATAYNKDLDLLYSIPHNLDITNNTRIMVTGDNGYFAFATPTIVQFYSQSDEASTGGSTTISAQETQTESIYTIITLCSCIGRVCVGEWLDCGACFDNYIPISPKICVENLEDVDVDIINITTNIVIDNSEILVNDIYFQSDLVLQNSTLTVNGVLYLEDVYIDGNSKIISTSDACANVEGSHFNIDLEDQQLSKGDEVIVLEAVCINGTASGIINTGNECLEGELLEDNGRLFVSLFDSGNCSKQIPPWLIAVIVGGVLIVFIVIAIVVAHSRIKYILLPFRNHEVDTS
eukprot:TRINITY_DN7734_c0_g2_i2.p1 TRINITY_DN7734_c0_g2~~TRINITY_DN7734_c0_g2_i2.p1  ORF type:complete len:439 (+),score=69.41 TRINITY_DN7734_c0_g2_i2:516-1832(+)